MKHSKIKLSVLALACLGAGALALQPAAYAKAEGEEFNYNANGVVMQDGAAVCLLENFSGIRWTTTVDAEWYNEVYYTMQKDADGNEYKDEEDNTVKKFKGIRFGVVVAPTGSFDGELTKDTTGAIDLHATDWKASTSADKTFYSVISYNQILNEYTGSLSDEEVLAKAYSMELTVRAYARYTLADDLNTEEDEENQHVYAYADMVDTSRSARQVALAAELAGDLDAYRESTDATVQAKAQKAAGYYGMGADAEDYYKDYVVSNGAAGTDYIDLEAVATADKDVGVELEIADGYTVDEVLVGSKKVAATYADGTLTLNLKAGQALPTGETYLKVFAKNKDSDVVVYTKPIIGATMVFDGFDDFDMFAGIRANLNENNKGDKKIYAAAPSTDPEKDLSQYMFGGYYVLGKSLVWDAEKDVAKVDPEGYEGAGWYGTGDFAKTKLGLTGTFNGLGHTIEGFQDGRTYTGLFQLVNGGTIKNTSFYNYTPTTSRAQVFAHYLIDPKIENVYIYSSGLMDPTKTHFILGTYLYQTKVDAAKLSNVFVDVTYASVDGSNKARTGGLFGEFSGTTQTDYNWNNVYVATNIGISSRSGTKSYVNINGSQKYIHIPKFVAAAENQKTDNGYALIEWRYKGDVAITLTDDGNMTATFTYKKVTYDIYSTDGDQTSTTFPADTIKYDGKNIVCLKGVKWYYDINAFNAAKGDHNGYKTFLAETGANCWKVTDGALSWGS